MDARVKIAATSALIVASFINNFLGFAVAALSSPLASSPGYPLGYVPGLANPQRSSSSSSLSRCSFTRETCLNRATCGGGAYSVSTGASTRQAFSRCASYLYYVTTMLMLTTSLVELTNGLELIFGPLQRLRVPVNELVLVFVIAIKFVPIFIEEMERLARAQTARGVPFDEKAAH